jgi:hypothetical protein
MALCLSLDMAEQFVRRPQQHAASHVEAHVEETARGEAKIVATLRWR